MWKPATRTRRSFFERSIRSRRRTTRLGAPPLWYGYLAPATGLAALTISIISAILSLNAYRVNKSNRDDTIAPKLTVVEVGLTHLRGKLQDVPVLSYQIKNYGTLVTNDIHTYLQYKYAVAPTDDLSKPIPSVGTNHESLGLGAKLVPGDHLDRVFPLMMHQVRTSTRPDQETFATAKDLPSYRKLKDGFGVLEVEISTEANDATGQRIVLCDAFGYQWITDRFERRGACLAFDIVDSFRQNKSHTGHIDPSTMTVVPDK